MIGKSLILLALLVPLIGAVPSSPVVRSFGILQFRPDGTKQSAVVYSDGTLDQAYISEKNTHYSDSHLVSDKADREKLFILATKIYASSNHTETPSINYDQLILSPDAKNKVIIFIETADKKTRRFERGFDEKFDSRDLKQLDSWLQTLLEK